MPDSAWPPSPARPVLVAGAIDVWAADLAAAHVREHDLLSPGERERAERFVRDGDGRRWAASRGILRALLGACTGADPRALAFEEGLNGKPRLAGENAPDLRFNLSHSGGTALYAVTLDREIGVDVELPRRATDHVAIARRILGDAAAERLQALDPPQREREFLRAWVRWEAVLKCRGTGIGGADRPAEGPEPWVHELAVARPAAAALAVERGPLDVRCWTWPPAAG